jgi:hypothetical protein
VNVDTAKNRQRRFIGRKVRSVWVARDSSGSFALERRALDDSKNKQRREQATAKYGDSGCARMTSGVVDDE